MKSPITKPALAAALEKEDWGQLDFSKHNYLATPKLDGIRALKVGGKLVSRSFKPIRNKHIREILEQLLPEGADGEIIGSSKEDFQNTSSSVMSGDGTPKFHFYWFDLVDGEVSTLDTPYSARTRHMYDYFCARTIHDKVVTTVKQEESQLKKYIKVLLPVSITSIEALEKYEQDCLDEGYEGVILRRADSPYKCGRSTAREQYLLKIKRFVDDEAIIIGFGEKMHNENEAQKDAFGRTKRSSAKEGKVPAGTLGYLIVMDVKTEKEFEIGTGFNDELRQTIWDNRDRYKGQIIVYKHFAQSGVLDLPRFPVFKGCRYADDLGE